MGNLKIENTSQNPGVMCTTDGEEVTVETSAKEDVVTGDVPGGSVSVRL